MKERAVPRNNERKGWARERANTRGWGVKMGVVLGNVQAQKNNTFMGVVAIFVTRAACHYSWDEVIRKSTSLHNLVSCVGVKEIYVKCARHASTPLCPRTRTRARHSSIGKRKRGDQPSCHV